MKAKKPPAYLYPALLGIGMFIAWISLMVNQQFHVSLSLASMFSPTGAQVSVAGFRIKHWLVGIIIVIIGAIMFFIEDKATKTKMVGVLMAGAGILLISDEHGDVIRTITTGQYP